MTNRHERQFGHVERERHVQSHDAWQNERFQFPGIHSHGRSTDPSLRQHDGAFTFGSPFSHHHFQQDGGRHHQEAGSKHHQEGGGKHHRGDDQPAAERVHHKNADAPARKHRDSAEAGMAHGGGEHFDKGQKIGGKVTWYDEGKRTASTEPFNPDAKTMNKEYGVPEVTGAHRTAEFGTKFLLRDESGHPKLVVRINDRGPALRTGASLDVNRAGGRVLGIIAKGHMQYSAEAI